MNAKLSFSPVSRNPVDLLAVVLDDEKTLHEIDDPAISAHVQRAAAAFRDKTLKREYLNNIAAGGLAGAIGFGVKTLVDRCERFRDPLA